MASAFSHAIAAFALGKAIYPAKLTAKIAITGMVCSAIPDLDAIGFWAGIPYESVWGHRGITHSFFFAALLSLAVSVLFFRNTKDIKPLYIWLYLFIATSSHAVLDAMTNGGMGVAFFAPFDNERYFFPLRPIMVSPISIAHFFSGRGIAVLKSEFVWIWIPSFIFILLSSALRRKSNLVN